MKYKKAFIFFILVICAVPFLLWLVPFAKNEILTLMHGDEFREEYKQSSWNIGFEKTEYFRVIEYSRNQAKVYYVEQDSSSGDVATFEKKGNKWVLIELDTKWTNGGGSADDILWPYFWDIFRFGWANR